MSHLCDCGFALAEKCPMCSLMRCKLCKKPKEVIGAAVNVDYKPCTCSFGDELADLVKGVPK